MRRLMEYGGRAQEPRWKTGFCIGKAKADRTLCSHKRSEGFCERPHMRNVLLRNPSKPRKGAERLQRGGIPNVWSGLRARERDNTRSFNHVSL